MNKVETPTEVLNRLDCAPKMITEKNCPVCDIPMWLKDVIAWGKAHKYDKQWKCHKCSLNLVEGGRRIIDLPLLS